LSAAELLDERASTGTQRIDKWLWFARFVKTRTLAASLVESGKVRLNRTRLEKPSQTVKPGDVLTLVVHRRVLLIRVVGIAERRGPSAAARALYEELTAEGDVIKPQSLSTPPGAVRQPSEGGPARPAGSGRPTKRERRQIDKLNDKLR